jgi:predicted RNA-binding Zn-ribbon protein involved in translation (DUF1610 family)
VKAVKALLGRAQDGVALPPPAPARLIRAVQCFRCGGYKRTESRTAYVYCDFCGALFDYDLALARASTAGSSDEQIFELLIDAVRPEIQRAFAAKDDAAYRAAWRWPYEMDMTLCPAGWSPRAGDPTYRKAMVEFSVETCVVHNRNRKRRAALAPLQQAQGIAMTSPSPKAFADWIDALRACLTIEVSSFRRAGVFELHPDGLDDATYLRVNVALGVLGWRGKISDDHFDGLLERAGITTAHVELESIGLGQGSCGQCSGKLLVVEGGSRVVCEACGHTLDRSASFACPTCGAHVIATPGARNATCAWCTSIVQLIS